ncbi:MAG: DNA polymerase III subunit beta [Brevinematia bacterium]
MKFHINSDVLGKLLKPVVKASSSNRTLQILNHIHFRVGGGGVEIVGANPEYTVRVKEWADVESEGEFLALGDKFFQIVKVLPPDLVTIEQSGEGSILIRSRSKATSFLLQTVSVEEYPKQILESIETSYNLEVSQGEMKKIVRKLIKFCSDSDTLQAVFTGFLFDLRENGRLVVVTTDTKRMGVFYSSYRSEDGYRNIKFVVPSDTLEILEDVLSDEGPLKVGINYDEEQSVRNVVFTTHSLTISSSVISGTFPNYEAVIPETLANYAIINRKDLEEAIKRVSVISDRESNRVIFSFDSEKLTVKTENSILGQASEVIPCRFFGNPDYVCFNYEFILDYLSTLESEEFYWGFNHYEHVNKFWSEKEKEFIHVAMPLRRV